MGAVAAGPHNLQHLHAGVGHRNGPFPHGGGTAADLVNGLRLGALGGQRRQKRRVLGLGGLAVHDLAHDGVGLVIAQVLLVHNLCDGLLNHDTLPLS